MLPHKSAVLVVMHVAAERFARVIRVMCKCLTKVAVPVTCSMHTAKTKGLLFVLQEVSVNFNSQMLIG